MDLLRSTPSNGVPDKTRHDQRTSIYLLLYVKIQRRFGSRPSAMACAAGVQNRASWLRFKGIRPASPSKARRWKPTQNASRIQPRPALFTLWQPRYNTSRASSSSLCDGHGTLVAVQALYFVAATKKNEPRLKLFALWQARTQSFVRAGVCVVRPL